MNRFAEKDYVVVVQCHIVKERCPGYLCEKALFDRAGGFVNYPKDKAYRSLSITCGGCCGRATHRKLSLLAKRLLKYEGIGKERIAVHLSSCITNDSYHGPRCPHLDYLKRLIANLGLEVFDGTVISKLTEKRRAEGLLPVYTPPE